VEFQVPVRFGTACTLTVWVCLPTPTTIAPSATTGALGEATFSAATAVTGSGTLVATADAGSIVGPGGFQVLLNPGLGTIHVP